jgi:transposase InsO family protein
MLTENELLRLYIQQHIPLIGRKAVETIRTSEPERRVGGGTHNVATRFASRKMGCIIQAESHKCELPAVYFWEHDPDTYEFYDQPSKVKLSYQNAGGKNISHLSTPDYFLIQECWMGWVECKPEEQLKTSYESGSNRYVPGENGAWRCPPGEEFASQFGLGFKVRSTQETNWMLVRNLEFLSDYLQDKCPPPSQETYFAAAKYFSGEQWILLQHLLEQQEVSTDSIFALIAYRLLIVDLERELLSEPGFTSVCIDSFSAQIYQHQMKGGSKQTIVPLHTILMASGTPIIWDGSPWRILNVGATDIFLEDENRDITNLRLDIFQTLVARGSISGIPAEADQRHVLAAKIMKRAAPIDLEGAIQRADHLNAAEIGIISVPARTLRYWQKRAVDGEITFGNRFAGLIPRISARGNRSRKVNTEVVVTMNEVIDADVLVNFQPKISVCYGRVRNLCAERGLLPPSEKTFRAEIKRRKEEAVVLARQGRRAAYKITEFQWYIDQSAPRHGERPFEIGHIDHTELDVELVDSRTGANLGRPWLTILLDAYTRLVLAFFLTFDPPSYRSCMAVIRNAVRRHGRIPKTIVVDQGSDFESLYFEALLARLETHKKSRPAAKGRFGSVIERFFGVNNQAFIHNLRGNSQSLQSPRSMSPSHDPRTLAVWTLPALTDAFEVFVDNTYAGLKHPALGMTPKEAMARGLAMTGCRDHILIPYTENFNRLCMPTTIAGKALVRSGRGIKIKGIFYWHPSFREATVTGTKVYIVYDPFDVSRAYALVGGDWVLCRSEYQALFERRTEREVAAITQEIRVLHHLADVRRSVNAGDIAAYVATARESEVVLLQQRRDAERQVNETHQTTLPIPSLGSHAPDEDNSWTTPISIEIFEELK